LDKKSIIVIFCHYQKKLITYVFLAILLSESSEEHFDGISA